MKNIKAKKGIKLIVELGQMPPNVLTPKVLSEVAGNSVQARLAPEWVGLNAVGGDKAYMGGTTYGEGTSLTALIGKGVTFDSGGISIKPGGGMKDMKFDCLGAATAIAVGKAYNVKEGSRLSVITPCAENSFHDNTYRPGDILSYPDGTRVEVDNTDAEGRLILADAILVAKQDPDLKLIITIATLTGAAAAALGEATAVISNDDALAKEFLGVVEDEEELAWQLPLWDVHRKAIKVKWEKKKKGDVGAAFICNSVRGGAGASTAAAFLEVFIGDTPWIHLDIAGSAYKDGVPTGVMYKSLVKFLNGRS